jgi:hypothetical protein
MIKFTIGMRKLVQNIIIGLATHASKLYTLSISATFRLFSFYICIFNRVKIFNCAPTVLLLDECVDVTNQPFKSALPRFTYPCSDRSAYFAQLCKR